MKNDIHAIAVKALCEGPFSARVKHSSDGWMYVSIVFKSVLAEGDWTKFAERSNRGIDSPAMSLPLVSVRYLLQASMDSASKHSA